MTKKFYTVLIIIFVLIASLLIQINFLNLIPLFGVVPNLGIILIAGLGLMNGKLVGGLTGAFYGMMVDIIFSRTLGINFILYIFVGIITGQISNHFSKDNKTAMIMIVVISTAIFEIINYLAISTLRGSTINFLYMIIIVTAESAYNLMLTTILHKFIVGLGEIVNRAKNSYYLL